MNAIPFQFPPGEILDRDGFTWLTLPPDTRIAQSRIHGVCSCDPSQLRFVQVTIERGDWKLDLLPSDREVPFPLAVGFPIAVPGTELDVASTSEAPVRITIRVRRTTGVPRDERGQIVLRLDPVMFHLVLVARGAEELSV